MPAAADRLFHLLPAILRLKDAEQAAPNGLGPLQSLLRVIEEQCDLVDQDIARMYENWFIETCEDWVVPYIGDLLGYHPPAEAGLPASPTREEGRRKNRYLAPRREVARTIGFRRRKGTLALLELLANDSAGWPARAVEFYRLLAFAQQVSLHHIGRGRTVDLRQGDLLDLIASPFDRTAHTVDVRRPNSARTHGLHNLPSVGVYVWRLGSYPITKALAHCLEEVGDGCYTFSILGNDAPLFIHPLAEPEPTHIAAEWNVPAPLRRRALATDLTAKGERRYYGPGLSLQIWKGEEGDLEPSPANAIPREMIRVADLSGWYYDPEPGTVVVDSVLGRFAFPEAELPAGDVWVSYHYGFSAEMGGGEYRRPVSTAPDAEVFRVAVHDSDHPLGDQLASWEAKRKTVPHAVLEIVDNGVYTETLEINLEPGESLQIRAAVGVRPMLSLQERRPARSDPMVIGGSGGRVTLDGLLIMGRGLRLEGEVECVTIRHCTLVPGWDLDCDCEPCNPEEPSLTLRRYGGRVRVLSSIIGAIHVIADEVKQDPVPVTIADSIVDATEVTHPAVGTPRGIAHAVLTVKRSTVIGVVMTHAVELAENSIFLGPLTVLRTQRGCIRFCFVPDDSRTPRRHHCQPDLAVAAAEPGSEDLARLRVEPDFLSLRYGTPTYCQLHELTAPEILQGADDEATLGAFHDLFEPQREATLRARLDEYTPADFNAAVLHAPVWEVTGHHHGDDHAR
jgi:hypothetical protein